jgi:hypothetical protein
MNRLMPKALSLLMAALIPAVYFAPSMHPSNLQHEGLFLIVVHEKYGYINHDGKVVIEPRFDEASDFSDGLAAVKLNGEWGYIGPDGKPVIEPTFDETQAGTSQMVLHS